jgi:signal transduction histidine kinase
LGRGLGLAVVQGIIRSHHGDIHFSSVPGKGSTFEILLPCVRKQADDIAGTAKDAAEQEKKSQFANA